MKVEPENKLLVAWLTRCIWLTVIYFLFLQPAIHGQGDRHNDYSPDKILRSNARVNPSTLAMEISIPLATLPGRGGSVPVAINYSSKVWDLKVIFESEEEHIASWAEGRFSHLAAAGWTSTMNLPRIDYDQYFRDIYYIDPQGNVRPFSLFLTVNFDLLYAKRLRVAMPGGGTVEFRKDDLIHERSSTTDPGDRTGTFLATDGSRMKLVLGETTSTLFTADGGRYLFSGSAETPHAFIDRNGNKTILDEEEQIDTLGRPIPNPIPLPISGGVPVTARTVGTEEFEYPGIGTSTREYNLVWAELEDVLDSGYSLRYLGQKNCYTNPPSTVSDALFVDNSFMACGGHTYSNPVVLSEVRFPDGSAYKFKYNSYGEISRIDYPTGGYERFEYASFTPLGSPISGFNQANRGVRYHWVSEGGGASERQWSYEAVNGDSAHLRITAPDGAYSEQYLHNDTNDYIVYGFGHLNTGRAYDTRTYTSSDAPLTRTLTKWTETGALSTNTPPGDVGARRDLRPEKEISIIFELGNTNALATMTETVYDTSGSTDAEYFSSLNPKQVKKYGYVVVGWTTALSATVDAAAAWFSGASPVVVSEMDYLYDANYKARNITGLVSETRVEDASGNVKARTQISYDDSGFTLTSSGTMPSAASGSWVDPTEELGSTLGAKRGNPTTVKKYFDITNGHYIETNSFFDQFGNQRKARDGRDKDTETLFDDDYAFAFPTKVITPVPDSSGTYGHDESLETLTTYDYQTGLPLIVTDPNGAQTESQYNDPLLRPTKVIAANDAETITEYGEPDESGQLSAAERFVKVKAQIDSDKWKEAYQWFDGLGRTVRSQSVDDDGDVFVLTCFDNMGRVAKTSNPFRGYTNQNCSTTSGMEWTTSTFDSAGRPWKVTTPDGAEVETTYDLATSGSQIGTIVTVEDQAGKLRRSISDGLQNLVRVDEPNSSNELGTVTSPNQPTVYGYDLLANLTSVQQDGDTSAECGGASSCTQTRSFVYDALSRLKQATNPESGTISYTYDENSNLKTKVDARSIKTIYDYDALNRVFKRCYRVISGSLGATSCATAGSETAEPNTPDVTYYYDNVSNAKGRLVKTSSSVSTTEYTSFDILGHETASKQTTDGVTYGNGSTDSAMTYTYNLAGALIEQQYPSGQKVKNVLDSSGDLALVQSRKNVNSGYWNYASSFTYNAAGGVTSMQLGNGRWESTTFNSRMQPTQIALGVTQVATNLLDLDYSYGTTANSGNVMSQTITVSTVGTSTGFTAVQSYSYDSLNRLKDATENITPHGGSQSQSWKQTFVFDRYGNRRFDFTSGNTTTPASSCTEAICNPTISPSNNRLTSTGWSYDSSGNTTDDPNGREFIYDAENKQVKVLDDEEETIGEYFYDGDARRVKKVVPSTGEVTIFVYDAAGKLIEEYSTIVASTSDAKVAYLTNDHLGSPRINTDANGVVTARHDYYPFGEEITTTQRIAELGYADDTIRKQFTGYELDGETELEFAQARYFSSSFGRFTTSDNFLNDTQAAIPQSWNLYIYVRNNPLRYVDPNGEDLKRNPKTGEIDYEEIGKGKTRFQVDMPILDKDKKPTGMTKTISWDVTAVYLTTTKGEKIVAGLVTGPIEVEVKNSKGERMEAESKAATDAFATTDFSNKTNCHGQTFAEGKFWIEDDASKVDPAAKNQVAKLMDADGYDVTKPVARPAQGDIALYTGTVLEHSARVTGVSASGIAILSEKSGIQAATTRQSSKPWGGNPTAKVAYYTKKVKQ